MLQAPTWQCRSPSTRNGMWTLIRIVSHSASLGSPAHVELGRRDPDALLPDRARARVVAGHATAADVGVMALGHAPERDLALPEDRLEDRDVRRVVVAAVGVVEDEDVALVDVAREALGDRAHRVRRRAHQHRDVGRLRDQAQVAVEDRGHEVARLGEDRRAAGAQHRLADLAADGVQPVADDRGQDRVGRGSDRHGFSAPLGSCRARRSAR